MGVSSLLLIQTDNGQCLTLGVYIQTKYTKNMIKSKNRGAGNVIQEMPTLEAPRETIDPDSILATFIEVLYGSKRRIILNPNASIRHITKFLNDRISDDYHGDFVTYTSFSLKREMVETHNGVETSLGVGGIRNRRKKSDSTSKRHDKLNPTHNTAQKSSTNLIERQATVPTVSKEEAYEHIVRLNSVKLELKNTR